MGAYLGAYNPPLIPQPTAPCARPSDFMAKHLDLEEQEQLAQLKHFWNRFGNLISWTLIVVFGAVAAWNGYQYWQRSQAAQAASMYDEVERAALSGDGPRLERSLADMKDRFGRTTYAQQADLLAAKVFYEKGLVDTARAALTSVAERSSDEGYKAIARLRLAGLAIDGKNYDEALKWLGESTPKEFDGLVADRKGDVFIAQGKRTEARAEYEKAYRLLGEADYRRLVEVKLNAMGVDPSESQASGKPAGPASTASRATETSK